MRIKYNVCIVYIINSINNKVLVVNNMQLNPEKISKQYISWSVFQVRLDCSDIENNLVKITSSETISSLGGWTSQEIMLIPNLDKAIFRSPKTEII